MLKRAKGVLWEESGLTEELARGNQPSVEAKWEGKAIAQGEAWTSWRPGRERQKLVWGAEWRMWFHVCWAEHIGNQLLTTIRLLKLDRTSDSSPAFHPLTEDIKTKRGDCIAWAWVSSWDWAATLVCTHLTALYTRSPGQTEMSKRQGEMCVCCLVKTSGL